MKKCFCFFIIIFSTSIFSFAIADVYGDWLKTLNIPYWVRYSFHENNLNRKFDYSFEINPMYLRGDFNGDNIPDIAILVKNNSSNKVGIIVFHFNSNDYFIIGAGTHFGNGGDDFGWITNWAVKRKERVDQEADNKRAPNLVAEAIYVEKAESASAIIYWDGAKYNWSHQGD
jgi:hypothetical protein